MTSQDDFNTEQRGLEMLREASAMLKGYVEKYYEMNVACDDLIFGYQLLPGMRVLSANAGDRSDLRSAAALMPGYHLETTKKFNRWVTIDSIRECGGGLLTFIAKSDDGVKRHYSTDKGAGWYICSVPPVTATIFQIPLSNDPAEMADYLVKFMGDLGYENGSEEFRQQMMEAAEFASNLLKEFGKPAEKAEGPLDKAFEALRNEKTGSKYPSKIHVEDPILFEEYDRVDGSSVRIEPGGEIPADAIVSTRRHIRKSDTTTDWAANTEKLNQHPDEYDIDAGVLKNPRPGDIVGDMDVTAFKADEPFAVDVETTPPSEVLNLDDKETN